MTNVVSSVIEIADAADVSFLARLIPPAITAMITAEQNATPPTRQPKTRFFNQPLRGEIPRALNGTPSNFFPNNQPSNTATTVENRKGIVNGRKPVID